MRSEPTIDEIPEDSDQPATRRDVALLREAIEKLGGTLKEKASKDDLNSLRLEMAAQARETKREILHHFDAAVENIEEALAGANADEISLLQDSKQDHDERIQTLEERAGLR